ncbi:hypothetical protein PN36_01410 [Candidatus Thiomargarita nelsonii]|uniref:Uncharacterized protein n=1 Tax=Candidatus Thiomargarita nelsonii TaxID=1003181 RepID=A0A4E0R7P9_9GAMM|nr:hypothetical protein PN36_01410 [Candidatus Thiomargarita nelsonii]
MKKAKKVTRIAYADDLNQAKYDALNKIAFEAKVFAVQRENFCLENIAVLFVQKSGAIMAQLAGLVPSSVRCVMAG